MNRRFTSKSSQVSGTSLETHKLRGSDKDIQDSTDSAAAGRSFNLAIVVGCEESIVESKLVKEAWNRTKLVGTLIIGRLGNWLKISQVVIIPEFWFRLLCSRRSLENVGRISTFAVARRQKQ